MTMCRVLDVCRSGFYAWLHKPVSDRAIEDQRLLVLVRASYAASSGVYGAPRVFLDLREVGETCGKHRVAKIMRINDIKALRGYKTPRTVKGRPSIIAPNRLQREFSVDHPDRVWVTDITYIRTWQGWLYLAVVMDLYSRRIVGWSMGRWINRHLVIDALNMAIGQRCPEGELIHHSDRGSQYTSDDFREELEKHGIQCSMSARGNCYDNAVVESFFGLMKRERVNRTRYLTRDEAKQDIFDYIERFYNRKRRHGYLGNISPAAFEKRNQSQFQTVH